MKNKQIKTFNVNQSKVRIDNYLSLKIEHISRTKIKKLILEGNILVDEKKVKPSMVLSGGETILCNLDLPNEQITLKPEKMNIDIIYEDEYFVVINKSAGIVVHPGNGNKVGTLANGLLYHFQNLSDPNSLRPGIVHRLDKDTSGVIIVAKNDNSHHALSELFQTRKISKCYESIVWGTPLKDKGKIHSFIKRDIRNKTAFKASDNDGKEAITKYEVLENYGPLSRIRVYPETGRTHQIRVHMKHIGHPVLGDDKYSGGIKQIKSFHTQHSQSLRRTFKFINRHMLHAYSINFVHPFTNKEVYFLAETPLDMKKIIKLWTNEI